MTQFKRNQVEEAIASIFDPHSAEPSTGLRTRLKRLLETDRNLGRNPRSADLEKATFAFFSSDAPGSGVEIWFSSYEAFALLTAWRLLEHGWPQTGAVSILRQARRRLQSEHARILKLDSGEQLIPQKRGAGSLVVDTGEPVFLVIASMQGDPRRRHSQTRSIEICRGEEQLMPILRREVGQSATTFELAAAAHMLEARLNEIQPTKRGRGSS